MQTLRYGRFMLGRRAVATIAAVTVAVLGLGIAPTYASGGTTTPGVMPPTGRPYGMTYAQWSARLWTWTIESPNIPSNPVTDPNPGAPSSPEPVDCTLGNRGPVWFLGGVFVGPQVPTYRSCSIPAGVALFLPIVDAVADNSNCPPAPATTFTADQLAGFVGQQTDAIVPGSMSATIDGRSVAGLQDASTQYRAAVGGFTYTLPDNSAWSAAFCSPSSPLPAGYTTPPPGAFADGVYMMLAPLRPGVHHVSFAATESGGPFGSFSESVSYTITVVP